MCKTAAASVFLLLICGSVQAALVKEGATADDIQRDQSECDRKARADIGFQSPPAMRGSGAFGGARTSNTMVKENQASRLCMKSKGYADPSDK